MGLATGRIALVAVVALLAVAPGASGGDRREPIARAACAPSGCTETINDNIPASGGGSSSTDAIPANANDGSVDLQPTCTSRASDAGALTGISPLGPVRARAAACTSEQTTEFDQITDLVVSEYPAIGKLSQKSKRFLTCVLLSPLAGQVYGNPNLDVRASNPSYIGLWMELCLKLAAAVISQPSARGAGAASAGCSTGPERIQITLERVRGGYSATATGVPKRPRSPSPVTISCRRDRIGLKVSMKPRSRHTTLPGLGANMLAVGFVNPTRATVGVHTAFRVN